MTPTFVARVDGALASILNFTIKIVQVVPCLGRISRGDAHSLSLTLQLEDLDVSDQRVLQSQNVDAASGMALEVGNEGGVDDECFPEHGGDLSGKTRDGLGSVHEGILKYNASAGKEVADSVTSALGVCDPLVQCHYFAHHHAHLCDPSSSQSSPPTYVSESERCELGTDKVSLVGFALVPLQEGVKGV